MKKRLLWIYDRANRAAEVSCGRDIRNDAPIFGSFLFPSSRVIRSAIEECEL